MYTRRKESGRKDGTLFLARVGLARRKVDFHLSYGRALLEQTDTEVRPRSCANVRNEVVQGQPMPRFSSRLPPSASSVHKDKQREKLSDREKSRRNALTLIRLINGERLQLTRVKVAFVLHASEIESQ